MTTRHPERQKLNRRKQRSSAGYLRQQLDQRTSELEQTQKLLTGALQQQAATTKAARKTSAARSAIGRPEEQLVECLSRERDEAVELQAASAEVLKTISSSPSNLKSVFEAMLANALRICEAKFGHVLLYDGEHFHAGYLHDAPPAYRTFWEQHGPISPSPNTGLGRLARTKQVVHIPDLKADTAYAEREPLRVVTVEQAGARSFLSVPMLKENELIGAIVIYRQEVRPFAEKQIDLVKNFADQAVIAIENARLFGEVRAKTRDLEEALVQQTGSANILNVIAMSPTDIAPVLQAIVENACHFCDAADAAITLKEGDQLRFRAHHGSIPLTVDLRPINRNWVNGRAVIDKIPVHVHDLFSADGDEFPLGREMATRHMIRTLLSVPLLRKDEAIGTIALRRIEAHPFSDKQIALLRSFADQAVIAIENVRLFDEVRAKSRDLEESLHQQTATADVLKVISRSAFDLKTVLDALLASACRLCEADFGTIRYREGSDYRLAATFGFKPEWIDHFSRYSEKPDRGSIFGRTIIDGRTVHIPDVLADPDFQRHSAQKLLGFRAALGVPLVRDGQTFGVISLHRLAVGSFDEKQIELLETFADQAVIAIQNVKLFDEVQAKTRDLEESLQQQTATSEVLQIISSSPGELAPVFDKMLENATRVCGAEFGSMYLVEDDSLRQAALYNAPAALAAARTNEVFRPHPQGSMAAAIRTKQAVQVADVRTTAAYLERFPYAVELAELGGARTLVNVPMLREDEVIGAITIYRQEVRPFAEKQIELVSNFAKQAVIAIENVRLLTETREALERQTATAEILQVINSSPGNLAPVFEAILEKAHSLCAVAQGALFLYDGGKFRAVALRGLSEAFGARLRRGFVVGPNLPHYGLLEGARFAQIPDWAEIDSPTARAALDAGLRTTLLIALRREGKLLGCIGASRSEVRPFSEKEIALLESFAAQAVIAIENARLLGELRQRTADLARSVDELTATGDVLKVISRSTVDLETALDTLVETVMRLCRADLSTMFRWRDDKYHLVASRGFSEEAKEFFRTHPVARGRGTMSGRVELERRAVHIPDVLEDPEYTYREGQKIIGFRTLLGIPLLREESLIGLFTISRTRVEPFTDKEIELASTFADQAVIAIENARLFEELRERQAELRVTFDNMCDGVVMFDAAGRLTAWNRNFQQLIELPESFLAGRPTLAEYFRYLADRGEFVSADLEAQLGRTVDDTGLEMRYERTRPDGRIIEVRRNPVPGGGFVLIYADITKRKQAEEAIRAARDAAETALRDLQAAQASLVHAQKMAALGQLTAGIAHEIKNPLNFVNNFAALSFELTDELSDVLKPVALPGKVGEEVKELTGTLKDNLGRVVQHGKRADSIVKNMLLHSREGSGEHRPVEINAIVDESLNLAYHGARAEKQGFNITLERDFDPAVGVADIYPQEITRVLLNLISNGFYAATQRAGAAGNGFEPRLKVVTRNLGDRVEVRVRDNGAGIPPDVQEKIFNPFFTTKPAGEGTGLGLSLSHDIVVKQHGGTIEVATEPGSFTEFIITLPRVMP